jgi:hypothetical protein
MFSSCVDPAGVLPEAALRPLWIWMITASWSSYCWVASLLSESPAAGTSHSGIFRFPEVS